MPHKDRLTTLCGVKITKTDSIIFHIGGEPMKEFEYDNYDHSEDYIEVSDEEDEDNDEKQSYKNRRFKKKKKIRFPVGRVFGAIVTLFLLAYVSMLVYTSNFTMTETEQADYFEVNDYVEAKAYAVRSEEYIQNTKDGIIAYVINDGDKVSAGGTVAKLFSNEAEVESWQKYNEISEELTILKQMTNADNGLFVDLDTVDAQIRNDITTFKNSLSGNRFGLARESKYDLLQLFNERTVVTGGSANFQPRIAELENALSGINVSNGIGDVKSKKSGIFVSSLDGFEKSADFSKVEGMMASDVEGFLKKDPPGDAIGKIITTINWYLLCPVTSEQAIMVTMGDSVVDVSIPKVISGTIPGTIISVNQGSKADEGLLVVKCDYMDGTLAGIREENITIKTKTYSGIRVSKKAVHEDYVTVVDHDEEGNVVGEPRKEKVRGVYVMFGRRLYFKQISIVYSAKDFVICDPDPANPELLNGETVALHDSVVVRGKELYDGKIIK